MMKDGFQDVQGRLLAAYGNCQATETKVRMNLWPEMSIPTAHHPHKPLSFRQITGGLLGYERCASENQGSRAVC